MKLSISTSWNYKDDADIRQMLAELKETGVDSLELGYRIRRDQLDQIIPLLKELNLSVTSLHNFCPLPDDAPSSRHPSNYYRLSSLDPEEQKLAVQWTNNCIDTALDLGAEVVVVHAGTLELENDPSGEVLRMFKEGKRESKEYEDVLNYMLRLRDEQKGPYVEALRGSLKQVMRYAHDKGMKIGLETRYYPIEIPNFEEIGFFLDMFHDKGMYYWHDVGHAEVNSRLGITPHMKYLETYQDKIIGWHLHGVLSARDHHAPFVGDFDLSIINPFVKEHHHRVIECAGFAAADQIKQAVKRLSGEAT